MATDIEIARQAKMKPIGEIATRLGIPEEALEPYGRTKAKIAMDWINQQQGREDGKLILVTAKTSRLRKTLAEEDPPWPPTSRSPAKPR